MTAFIYRVPPVNLPNDATKSGFFTKTRDGEVSESNHLYYEDRPGQEKVSIKGQKDYNVHVKNDQTQLIEGNQSSTIDGKRSHTTHSTSDVTLDSGRENTYEGDHQKSVDTQLTEEYGGDSTQEYKDGVDETIKGAFKGVVKGVAKHELHSLFTNTDSSDEEKVNGNVSEKIGTEQLSQIQGGSRTTAGNTEYQANTYDIESKEGDTTVHADSHTIKPQAGAYYDAKTSIEHKSPSTSEFGVMDDTMSDQSVKQGKMAITLAQVKDTFAASKTSNNKFDLKLNGRSDSAAQMASRMAAANIGLIETHDKTGDMLLKLAGLSLEKGIFTWKSGGKGGGSKGPNDKNGGGGGGDGANPNNKTGKGHQHDAEKKPNECKECQNLARSIRSIGFAVGDETFEHLDFTLGDALPIVWSRTYVSDCYAFDKPGVLSPFGPRWFNDFTRYVYAEGDHFVYIDSLGRPVQSKPDLEINETWYDRKEELFWERVSKSIIRIRYKNYSYEQYEAMSDVYRLTVIRDANKNQIELEYNHKGELSTLSSALYTLNFEHDEEHRITRISYEGLAEDSDEPQTIELAQYKYDGVQRPSVLEDSKENKESTTEGGDLIEAIDRYGSSNHYRYSNHLITRYTDKTDRGVSLSWETIAGKPRCVQEVLDDNTMRISLRYDRENGTTYVTDGLGQTTKYVFNAENYLLAIHYSEGTSRINERDQYNNITQVKYPDGTVVKFVYDAFDNIVEQINPDGSNIEYTYNAENDLVLLKDPNGSEWVREYDSHHQVTKQTDPLGHVTEYGYDVQGNVTRVIDAKGGVKHLLYTATGNLSAYRDCSGKTTSYEYDNFDRLTKVTDPSGTTEEYLYDDSGGVKTPGARTAVAEVGKAPTRTKKPARVSSTMPKKKRL